MESHFNSSLQNLDGHKSDNLKKKSLIVSNSSSGTSFTQNTVRRDVLMNNLRTPISSSMIVPSVQAQQSSIPITHNLVTHSIAPVKIHTNSSSYPLQLSTVHVPVQISGPANSIPIIAPSVSLPLQVSGTTNVPVQLPAGDTINVALQLPSVNQNLQITSSGLSSLPLTQNSSQSIHNSLFHLHMNSGTRLTNIENSEMDRKSQELNNSLVKTNTCTTSQLQLTPSSSVVQMSTSSNNSIQLTLPNSGSTGTVQLRGSHRTLPHVVYIQTPNGLKPVSSSEVITQASTSGNPPQIIVRRPVSNSSNIQLLSNVATKNNVAPKGGTQNKSSIIATNTTPIVIQKPKGDKVIVPVSISSGTTGKQTIAYLGSVKKPTKVTENSSILLQNNQTTVSQNMNQKLFLTPMMPKIQNTKLIIPVTLPASMASKGPVINLQIANGQIQNDPQGNITVMRDTGNTESNGASNLQTIANDKGAGSIPQGPKSDKAFALTYPGSRAEQTGEQEYSLSIPENSSINDDLYTVSIADDESGHIKESPHKIKGIHRSSIDKNEVYNVTPAPAILRRSNSENNERKNNNINLKRRISLCNDMSNKTMKVSISQKLHDREAQAEPDMNDDHRVPSLFCDEKLDKDLESKSSLNEFEVEVYKDDNAKKVEFNKAEHSKFAIKKTRKDTSESIIDEDPPGLLWANGVAKLNGSSLHFQTNEFGLIDLIENSDQEDNFMLNASNKYSMPLKQRVDRGNREKKPTSPEDLYRCDSCGCHGMAAEFITPNFCSLTCQNDYKKIEQKRRDRERIELIKKRNKIKKLLMKKQLSESDSIAQDSKDDKTVLKNYDSASSEARLSEVALMKVNEESIENEKYPWMCGKNGFSWMRYLEFCKAKAAPVKLFKDPFPYNRNGFKIGMRMEAIDPQHPSTFCVVSVAEIQGYRMRLHFDEYPDIYDYWVNADCIDIYPPGWCEKNGRTLMPPQGYTPANFSWPLYLKQMRAIAAPRHLFPHMSSTMFRPNGFRTGMKLEAEDRKNNLVCVATISDMMDNRMLINFDSWDEMYDYWVDPTSPYIHPVGWADENEAVLTPPNFFKDPEEFTWESYLAETGSTAAPARAFKTRPPQGFKVGMKLEVVDKRVPFLIRVASVNEIKGHQVLISFDGWPDEYSYWLDDDSPDIHPVGWCLKTGHPLEPPLTGEELSIAGACGVAGCRGLGSARGGGIKQHCTADSCPYRLPAAPTPQRIVVATNALPIPTRPQLVRSSKSVQASTPTSDATRDRVPRRGRPPKHKTNETTKTEPASDDESVSSAVSKRYRRTADELSASKLTYRDVENGVTREYRVRSGDTALGPPPNVHKHIEELALPVKPTAWTQNDVRAFITSLAGSATGSAIFAAKLSGTELVMVSCEELVECAKLRLGPAIKVYAAVRQLREALS